MPLHVVLSPKWLDIAFTAMNWTGILRRQMHFILVLLKISSEIRAIIASVIVADLVRSVRFGVPTTEICQCHSYFGETFIILQLVLLFEAPLADLTGK